MGYLQAILSFLIWGAVSPLLVRLTPLPAPAITFTGSAIGAAILVLYVGRDGRRKIAAAFRQFTWRIVAYGVCFIGCSMTFHWSIKTTTLANAEITHSLQALITCVVLMPLFGLKRLAGREYFALAIGLTGLLVAMPMRLAWSEHGTGIMLGLLSAVFYAAMNLQVSRFTKQLEPLTLLACCLIVITAAAPFAAVVYITAIGPITPTGPFGATAWLGLIGLGVMNFIAANLLFIRSLKSVPVSHVSILGYTEPVIGIAAGAIVLGEPITMSIIIGGAMVLASSMLVMRNEDG